MLERERIVKLVVVRLKAAEVKLETAEGGGSCNFGDAGLSTIRGRKQRLGQGEKNEGERRAREERVEVLHLQWASESVNSDFYSWKDLLRPLRLSQRALTLGDGV